MANITKLTVDNNTYDIKDTTARTNIDNLSLYSSSETIIGKWINNETIYRKVITYTNDSTIGSAGTVTNISIPHNTPNLSLLLNAKLIKGGYNFPTLGGSSNVERSTSILQVTSTSITLRIINDSWGASTWYIVIEYIKN